MRHPHIAILVASFTLPGAGGAPAQYPAKPARIVVPATAGDGSDVLARTLARAMGE